MTACRDTIGNLSCSQVTPMPAQKMRAQSNAAAPAAGLRAALYLRVSTGRQAEHDLSIPDQRAQTIGWVAARGWPVIAEYVEPGASAMDDKRPEFQRMIERACGEERPFDVVVVHSVSRFFRDAFGLEFYVRKLAKHNVRLVSITQELGDDPAQVMMRQVIALFDEYQSKENAKHVLRSMKENARQGFWNGARPPFGYRTIEVEKRGARIKKRLEIDPVEAEQVQLIFKLVQGGHEGEGAERCQGHRDMAQRARLSHAAGRALGPRGVTPAHHQSSLRRALAFQFDGFKDAAAQDRCRAHLC